MSRFLFSFFFFCYSLECFATPLKIEMIFMSVGKVTELLRMIEKGDENKILKIMAENDQTYTDNCIPMGEGCFHPQYGYLNRKPLLSPILAKASVREYETVETKSTETKDPDLQLKTFNAVETSMINCDKGNYFDIFCGKEKPVKKFAEIEIWFDVSSSLRALDYNKDPNFCNRRTFLTKVMEGCKDKVSASIYNTSLKQIGDLSSACLSYGGNEESKLLQWIKDSQAQTLLIVTDIDEMSKEMRDFLDSRGAKFLGEMKAFTSTDLVDYAKEFTKLCHK